MIMTRNDGTRWKPSFNPETPLIGLIDRDQAYYFREVRRFLWFFWIPTGKVWIGGDLRDGGFS